MSQFFHVHAENPQTRLIAQAVAMLRSGAVAAYPTDSCYALGCLIGQKEPMERIQRIRHLDKSHNFTLICRDLSEIATYAKVDNTAYRLLRSLTPGPYTFILPATSEVPRRLQNPKRKTIGVRVPDHVVARTLLEALGEPMLSVTLMLPEDTLPLTDPEEMRDRIGHLVDVIIDAGNCGIDMTTVVDLTDSTSPIIVRAGKGSLEPFAHTIG
ncbi:MAG: L-threonylcarbamoyladenylate synthase [Gammaproteobacteria bacterium]|nr:L-threonylcarbamoyladenylate synthase [Gammaproteobacteria bacterium]